jgi:hypothetical protein
MNTSEIKEMASLFATVVFRYESRSPNGEARQLARSSVNLNTGRRTWLLNPSAELCIPQNLVTD